MTKNYSIRLAMALLGLTASLMAFASSTAEVTRTTFLFNGKHHLSLDRYEVADSSVNRPAIIFAFGGGFTHGERSDERYMDYFRFMARQGYVVCTIDYRTLLAGFKPTATGKEAMKQFGTAIVEAIKAATEDFLTATGYVLSKSSEWGIDPKKIIASGSSAGAITALQAEYTLTKGVPTPLPAGFNYAAAVTFAGALLSEGEPDVGSNLCPLMLFHGDADNRVPYNKLELGPVGLYGSHYLAEKIKAAGGSGAFWTEEGATHDMALRPMKENLYDIAGFLHHVLDGGQKDFQWTTVTVPGRGEYRHNFTLLDFIRSNMPQQ